MRLARRRWALGCVAVALLGGALAAAAQAFDPAVEAANFAKGTERQTIYLTPQYQLLLRETSASNEAVAAAIRTSDPERSFQGNACAREDDACAGDVRLYDWQAKGYGLVAPVLFTSRDGATISGHVWATRAGPARRPGIVITSGSVQADEQMYWYAAQALAKAGYVVLTTDPQGQGQSDTQGEPPDQNEGYPAQSDGRPFFDGTEDAIDFLLSTPQRPYEPVPSCTTGTSHAAKQDRRARAGLDAAFDPFWRMLDPSRLGLAGHSFGATGVSYIGQWDPRVKAIVAWDNLRSPNPTQYPPAQGILTGGAQPAGELGCPANPAARTVPPITKPALGMSADYFLPPTPNASDPDPLAKSVESLAYSKAGVDTGEIVIRGGTHLDFSFIPDPAFPATLRGADMIAWYTTAWFDKYLRGDCTADRRLLTNRWRHDAQEAAIDQPGHDGNMFSFYYRSRLDIHLAGGRRYVNEDLRDDPRGLTDADGYPGAYGYLDVARSPDTATIDFGSCPAAARRSAGRRFTARHPARRRASRHSRRRSRPARRRARARFTG